MAPGAVVAAATPREQRAFGVGVALARGAEKGDMAHAVGTVGAIGSVGVHAYQYARRAIALQWSDYAAAVFAAGFRERFVFAGGV